MVLQVTSKVSHQQCQGLCLYRVPIAHRVHAPLIQCLGRCKLDASQSCLRIDAVLHTYLCKYRVGTGIPIAKSR